MRKKTRALLFILLACIPLSSRAQYNTLWIPDTLSGTQFSLTIRDTFAQVISTGNQTITGGINGKFWGPTLIFQKGDTVHMSVLNKLNDSTTLHWHGMHLPAVMDGGPHQVIPPGTLWQPYWKVMNNAGTYWYHPHLHMMAEEQVTKGIGGMIIVRDATEAALALPRKYGVDDIPLVLTDRSFNGSNQFNVAHYGDSMMVNGTLRPQFTIPAQVVRLRVLNAALERSYNLGFSDNRTFYVMATDGGLIDNPVPLTRFLISPGERIEMLVNCTSQSGTSVDLKAYNSTLPQSIGGGENFPTGPFANALGKKDFNVLHLNIGAQTSGAVTSIPAALTANTFPAASSANTTRTLTISDSVNGAGPPVAFLLGHKLFDINYISHNVPLGNTEIWDLKSTSTFSHPFHIHDVEFSILSVNGAAPPAEQAGWKDVILVKANTEVKFIARFDDYADATHPFMYHCHIALHEDDGMMGQFIVTASSGISTTASSAHDYRLYPNPANDRLFIKPLQSGSEVYYVRIVNTAGRTVLMLPQPDLKSGIDLSRLAAGDYFMLITDKESKTTVARPFSKF
jgi:bilirubin oxidase